MLTPDTVSILRNSLIRTAAPNAARWAQTGSKLGNDLRDRNLDPQTRTKLLYALGTELLELDGEAEARWAGHFGDDHQDEADGFNAEE